MDIEAVLGAPSTGTTRNRAVGERSHGDRFYDERMKLAHRHVLSSGHRIHCVEVDDPEITEGDRSERQLVVLIHGFPESWYSWRHQLPALAHAGFRPLAIDVRGYGRSDAPTEIDAYSMTALVGDVMAVIDDGEVDEAVVIGHDWGAPIAWTTALWRPDRIKGVAGLSVPYNPRGDVKPLDGLRALAGDKLFYIDYFQEPGVVEREVAEDLARWLRGFYFSASAEVDPSKPSIGFVERGGRMCDVMQQPADEQMAWMSDADFAFYLSEFERTGLTGGFNRYRNITRDWHELAPWRFAPITVPSLFIGGDRDGPTVLGSKAIANFDTNLPALRGTHILDNCGHWVQQERPDEVNRLLVEFIAGLG